MWYVLIERQDDELQMVKYNNKQGFNLYEFVESLKKHYARDPEMKPLIEGLETTGNDKFSVIKNIPRTEVHGKKLVDIIVGDLIELLKD